MLLSQNKKILKSQIWAPRDWGVVQWENTPLLYRRPWGREDLRVQVRKLDKEEKQICVGGQHQDWTWEVGHLVEHLLRTHDALSGTLVPHNLGEVEHTCYLSTWVVQAEGSEVQGHLHPQRVWYQPGLGETLSQRKQAYKDRAAANKIEGRNREKLLRQEDN